MIAELFSAFFVRAVTKGELCAVLLFFSAAFYKGTSSSSFLASFFFPLDTLLSFFFYYCGGSLNFSSAVDFLGGLFFIFISDVVRGRVQNMSL